MRTARISGAAAAVVLIVIGVGLNGLWRAREVTRTVSVVDEAGSTLAGLFEGLQPDPRYDPKLVVAMQLKQPECHVSVLARILSAVEAVAYAQSNPCSVGNCAECSSQQWADTWALCCNPQNNGLFPTTYNDYQNPWNAGYVWTCEQGCSGNCANTCITRACDNGRPPLPPDPCNGATPCDDWSDCGPEEVCNDGCCGPCQGECLYRTAYGSCAPDLGVCQSQGNCLFCDDLGSCYPNSAVCFYGECISDKSNPLYGNCALPSPIIVDVVGNGFSLSDARGGVEFDIFAIGIKYRISWTQIGSDDAFLVLDRDGNGLIDSGRELFGTSTPQPPSERRSGFLALAEFDRRENGGNQDGVIDARDAVFPRLRLWQDINHDGLSQTQELVTLGSRQIDSISLSFRESERQDRYGNKFHYRAAVDDAAHSHVGRWAYDVFLLRP